MSTTDLSAFTRRSNPKVRECPVGLALSKMKPGERSRYEHALDQPNAVITAKAVCEVLEAEHGVRVKYGAVSSHRRRACTCFND